MHPQVSELWHGIRSAVQQTIPGRHYYITGWLNVLRDGTVLDWHTHNQHGTPGILHGYMSVDSEPTVTAYRIDNDTVNVENKNGYLVFGYSTRDQHCTMPMPNGRTRVSIAFNAVPADSQSDRSLFGHWTPLT